MDKIKNMVTQQIVSNKFYYKDGGLFYKKNSRGKGIANNRAGSLDNDYRRVKVNDRSYYEHRLIWLLFYGYMPKFIDHVNGIKDDNRLENLRVASVSQNRMNMGRYKSNTTGFKGVYFVSKTKKWGSSISYNKKRIFLGYYDTINAAAECYKNAAKVYHGEFANISTTNSRNG